MATKSDIITLPNTNLREESDSVGVVDETTQKLIDDMISATLDWEESREHEVGVALAAVQIDVHLRAVIVRQDFDDKKNTNFEVFLNPKITKYAGEVVEDYEGCLSIKDVYGKVPRHTKVTVKAKGLDGSPITLKAEGFLARVFQHEIDHTNGVLFVDHIKDSPDSFYSISENGKIEKLDDDTREKVFSILW